MYMHDNTVMLSFSLVDMPQKVYTLMHINKNKNVRLFNREINENTYIRSYIHMYVHISSVSGVVHHLSFKVVHITDEAAHMYVLHSYISMYVNIYIRNMINVII